MSSSHCAAHREALAAKDASESFTYSKEFDTIVSNLSTYFSRSALRSSKLKEVFAEVGEKALKLCKIHKIRWMSRFQAVRSIHRSLPVLLALFNSNQQAEEGDPNAQHFEDLSSFRF